MTPSISIAILALAFTIASFWWIQVRTGRLLSYKPRTYAGSYGAGGKTILLFPLVLHNTGPAPIVVVDFRLTLDIGPDPATRNQEGFDLPISIRWTAIQPSLHPAEKLGLGGRVHPSPIVVNGRQALERFIEFGWDNRLLRIADGPYMATVEAQLGHSHRWREIVTFPLHTEIAAAGAPIPFITRTNDPAWTT